MPSPPRPPRPPRLCAMASVAAKIASAVTTATKPDFVFVMIISPLLSGDETLLIYVQCCSPCNNDYYDRPTLSLKLNLNKYAQINYAYEVLIGILCSHVDG
jgi:hypothetical protein